MAVGRTLQRAEVAVLEAQIVALKETNKWLVKQLDCVREERDELRQQRDQWQTPQSPAAALRGWLWRTG